MQKLFFSIITVFLISLMQPLLAFSAESGEVSVIIGYENDTGKQLIIQNSNQIDFESSELKAMAVTIDSTNLKKLREKPSIDYVEKNMEIGLSNLDDDIEKKPLTMGEDYGQWNLKSISAGRAWDEGFTGENINIAVIDTGIAPHPDLEVAGGVSTVEGIDDWTDDNGHGTHVAGIIGAESNNSGVIGVAPDANIYAVKALDSNGEGTVESLVEGIHWAIENDMDIINLSLGTDFNSESLQKAINKAYSEGILIVSASGNGGAGTSVMYPAKYENVIGVSAVNETFTITSFSSVGPEVEFSAPGKNIISTYLNGSYGIADGTSQASPHVSGMLALLMEKHPEKTAVELRKELTSLTQDLGIDGRDELYGYGFINYFPDLTAPDEVQNIQAEKITTESFFVSWKNPVDKDFAKLYMYMNGKLVSEFPAAALLGYEVKGLKPDTEYTLEFFTEDRFGNQSEGIKYTVKTKPVEKVVIESGESEEKQNSERPDEQVEDEPIEDKAAGETIEEEKNPSQSEYYVTVTPEQKTSDDSNPDEVSGDGMVITVPGLADSKTAKKEEPEVEKKKDTEIEEKVEASSVKDEPEEEATSSDKDEEQGFFSKLFESIAKVFVSIVDWIIGLF